MARRHINMITCDLCKNEISSNEPWPTIQYPLTADERNALLEASVPAQLRSLVPAFVVGNKPQVATIDVCRPCLDAILPDVAAIKSAKVRESIAQVEDR